MPTRLLAIGDIHLGRSSRRLPEGLDPDRFGPADALRRAARSAIELDVDAVLLAGDVADEERDLYHAHGVLTAVLRDLAGAGIPVFAVAGNHDHQVLPRLVRTFDQGLHLLGRGGTWEVVTVTGDGGPVDVLGWSFPARHHVVSPLEAPLPSPLQAPTIGLLHADLDANGGRYAPVSRHALATAGPVRWLLGHIHQPTLSPTDQSAGYLGSLVGLDPGEIGPRGPWLVEVTGTEITLSHRASAPLVWDRAEIAIDELAAPGEDLEMFLSQRLRALADDLTTTYPWAEVVGLRVVLTGRTTRLRELDRACAVMAEAGYTVEAAGLLIFVDDLVNRATTAHDLRALADGDDLPGQLARELAELLALDDVALHQVMARPLEAADQQASFTPLAADEWTAAELRAHVQQAAFWLLDRLAEDEEPTHDPA